MASKAKFYINFWRLFGILLLSAFTGSGFATEFPSAVGTFSGTMSGKVTPPGVATTQTVIITITKQSGGDLEGTITVNPAGLSTTFNTATIDSSGFIDLPGAPGFNASASVLVGGGFAGPFDGSILTINGPGGTGSLIIVSIGGKTYELGGTLVFSGGTVIAPETAAGTTIKDAGTIQTEVNSTANPVHTHMRHSLHGDARGKSLNETGFFIEEEGGLNAGDLQLGNVGVWLSYNYTRSENDFFRTAFESDRHTVVGGVDFSPGERFIAGLAVAWEDSSTDTTFNSGELDSDGYTVSPYFGALLSDTWSLDASFGLSFIENDQFRTDPVTGTRVTSDPDTDRFYFSANLNGFSTIDNWIVGGRLGYLFARSKTDRFTESNGSQVGERVTKLGQLRLGGDVAYSYGNWEPFVSGLYEYDFSLDEIELTSGAQPDNDRDDIYVSAGLRFFDDGGLSGNLEYSKRLLREDFDEDSITLTVRYDY